MSRAEAEEESLRLSTAALGHKVQGLEQEVERVQQEVVVAEAAAEKAGASRDEANRKLEASLQRYDILDINMPSTITHPTTYQHTLRSHLPTYPYYRPPIPT